MPVDAALTWIASLSFWDGYGSWRATVHRVLRCARRPLCRESSLAWLPFYCAEATGCVPERVVPVAAAWLLLYIAAWLFDTVEDEEFEPTDWDGLSQAQVINVASAFLAAIPLVLADLEDLDAELKLDFQRVALQMAAGQHADLSGWIGSGEEAVERYWQVAMAKSSVLFALACRLGAQLGNPLDEVLAAYADFGHALGRLIQACDDYEDTYRSGNLSGLQVGQASLPLVYARAVAGLQEREQIEYLLSRVATDAQAAAQLWQLLDNLGARHYLLFQAELLGQRAKGALHRAGVTGPSLDRLLRLVPSVQDRD